MNWKGRVMLRKGRKKSIYEILLKRKKKWKIYFRKYEEKLWKKEIIYVK